MVKKAYRVAGTNLNHRTKRRDSKEVKQMEDTIHLPGIEVPQIDMQQIVDYMREKLQEVRNAETEPDRTYALGKFDGSFTVLSILCESYCSGEDVIRAKKVREQLQDERQEANEAFWKRMDKELKK